MDNVLLCQTIKWEKTASVWNVRVVETRREPDWSVLKACKVAGKLIEESLGKSEGDHIQAF